MTCRVTFGTETVIMIAVPPRGGSPPPAGGTLFARAYLIAWYGGARLVGAWVCVPHELVVGRRGDGQMVAHRQRAP
ncbi:MAG: hypothetical protein WCF33_17850 [Pseudonocardiaceae bacterium]